VSVAWEFALFPIRCAGNASNFIAAGERSFLELRRRSRPEV
jgi:hypothetical protein